MFLRRLHLDYGDILYHQPYNESINSKLESIQCNAALAITGALKGTSRSKLYKELGLESLKSRRTLRRLCTSQNSIYLSSNLSFQLNPPINTYLSNKNFR